MSNITSILNSTAHEFEIKTSQERFPKDYMEKSLSFYTSLSKKKKKKEVSISERLKIKAYYMKQKNGL